MKKLFIIGNGFDLYHGIPSKYSDFGIYLAKIDPRLYEILGGYFDPNHLWSEFEQTLAEFDGDQLVDYAKQFLEPPFGEDWSDSYNHDYQYEIEQVVNALSVDSKSRFTRWILQLEIPTRNNFTQRLSYIDKDAMFLNFNYTSTLQRLYSIPEKNIIFIHGKAVDENSDLVLGHNWNPKNKPKTDHQKFIDDKDVRIIQGDALINEYFLKTFKQTNNIIKANKKYFTSMNSMDEIYILGHSISEVDIGYFREIVKSINPNVVKWYISYWGKNDLKLHKRKMRELGIQENLIDFATLENLDNKL